LKPWQIVLGKFLGAFTILLLMTVGTAVNLIPLYMYGSPETTNILSGYIGFLLLGMASLAIGQLFSAMTQNQVIAALITVPILLGFWFIGHLYSFQSAVILQKVFGYMSFSLHFGDFIAGLIRSEAVVYYLVVGAIALTLNASYLQWRR
jgi:gliding motility-associated transport system permease protein